MVWSKDNDKHSICDNYFLPVLSININSFIENFYGMELNSAFGYFWGGFVFGSGNFGVFKENPRAFLVLIFAPFYHPLTSTLEYPMGIKDMGEWGGGGDFSNQITRSPKQSIVVFDHRDYALM